MFGGAFGQGEGGLLEEIGSANDRGWDMAVGSFLNGALSVYFGRSWGEEGGLDEVRGESRAEWKGRTKSFWSGIIALSADGMPWVGKLSSKITGREESSVVVVSGDNILEGGEWICAGYSGEGYVENKMMIEIIIFLTEDWQNGACVVVEQSDGAAGAGQGGRIPASKVPCRREEMEAGSDIESAVESTELALLAQARNQY
jgi:hypothetical protein